MRRFELSIDFRAVFFYLASLPVLAFLGAAVVANPWTAFLVLAATAAVVLLRAGPTALYGTGLLVFVTSGFTSARGIPETTWLGLGALCVLGAWALSLRATAGGGRGLPEYLLFAFLAVVAVVGIATALGNEHQAITGVRAWAFLALLFWVGKHVAARERDLWAAVRWTGLVLGIVFLYGTKQFFLGYTAAEAELVQERHASIFWEGVLRLSSTLPTTQDFGALIFMTVPPLIAAWVIRDRKPLFRVALFLLTIFGLNMALLNMVRSAALGVLAGLLVVALIASRQKRSFPRVVLVGGLGMIVFVQLLSVLETDHASAVRSRLATFETVASDPALQERLGVVWPEVGSEILKEPWGHGVATTGGPGFSVLPADQVVIPDNGYLTLGYELGIVGAAIFVAWLGSVLYAGARGARRGESPLARGVCLGAVGSVAALATAMMTGSFVQLPAVQLILFPLAGAAVALSRRKPKGEAERETALSHEGRAR